MGNSSHKEKNHGSIGCTNFQIYKNRPHFASEYSIASFSNNLSGRSWLSNSSHQSTCSVSRPWSRISRRRWHESTLNDPLEAAKTAWPVPLMEAVFLPDFKINGEITEKSFEVLGHISKGAYGHVYHVRKRDCNQEYALKILSKSQLVAENGVHQVKDEVRIQSLCGHHPFIVNSPFFWQSHKQIFIVSEYMPGGELLALWQNHGALPEPVVQLYVAELALGLDFLHNAGVIFRDLKLENILLDAEGHAKIIDFGMAKWLKFGERTSTLCGTVQYMAPELVSLEPYGHAVDWWALGIITYCLLAGEFPSRSITMGKSDEGTAEQSPSSSLPAYCSIASRDLMSRLLCLDPRKRLHSLLSLQSIAFFKNFSFTDTRAMKQSPQKLLATFVRKKPAFLNQDCTESYDKLPTFQFKDFDCDFTQ